MEQERCQNMDYKTEIPTQEDLKILEELKKYPSLYEVIKQQPEYIMGKIYKVIKAFYS
jgi:hypothetical protein